MTNRENPIHRIKSYLGFGSGSKSKWYGSETLQKSKLYGLKDKNYFQSIQKKCFDLKRKPNSTNRGTESLPQVLIFQSLYL